MLEQKTQIFLRRLREQSSLAYSENTLSGIFYVMYGFVEIIENDPIFSKFIQTKVYEENEIQRNINKEYREKKMDKQLWHELFACMLLINFGTNTIPYLKRLMTL